MAINTTTARADIFKEFYAVIKDNILTTGVKVTNSYVDDETQLPQIVIHPPTLPRSRLAFGVESGAFDRSGDMEIEVIAKKTKDVVELYDDVEQAIFGNLDDISVQNVHAGDGSVGNFTIGGVSANIMTIPIGFTFKR